MRKRPIKKSFYLTNSEFELLKKRAFDVGLSVSDYLRSLIENVIPREKPGKEFYDEIKNLRLIGNNLNQLTKYVNTTGILKERDILKALELVNTFIYELQEKYLVKEEFTVAIETK
jgi:hypothetical protein